jgi:hypothetical protein
MENNCLWGIYSCRRRSKAAVIRHNCAAIFLGEGNERKGIIGRLAILTHPHAPAPCFLVKNQKKKYALSLGTEGVDVCSCLFDVDNT